MFEENKLESTGWEVWRIVLIVSCLIGILGILLVVYIIIRCYRNTGFGSRYWRRRARDLIKKEKEKQEATSNELETRNITKNVLSDLDQENNSQEVTPL